MHQLDNKKFKSMSVIISLPFTRVILPLSYTFLTPFIPTLVQYNF